VTVPHAREPPVKAADRPISIEESLSLAEIEGGVEGAARDAAYAAVKDPLIGWQYASSPRSRNDRRMCVKFTRYGSCAFTEARYPKKGLGKQGGKFLERD